MSRLGHSLHSPGDHSPEDVDAFLDAAGSFSRHFDVDVDYVLREIAVTLKRRVEFDRLRKRFGVSLPKP
jgi:hypothetical protein